MGETITFIHSFKNKKNESFTVAGLIKLLASLDPELAIVATWEGVECPITRYSIFKANLQYVATKPTVMYFDFNEHF